MLQKERIDKILEHVSQTPENLKKCEDAVAAGDMDDAIQILETDKTFRAYFFTMLKKADFGVQSSGDLKFAVYGLGADLFSVFIRSYAIFLKSPKIWKSLNINTIGLAEFNAKFICDWINLLKHIKKKNPKNLMLGAHMLLNLIICELTFANENFSEIISKSDLCYDKIFKNIYGASIFESVCKIAGWDLKRVSVVDRRIVGYLQLLLIYEFDLAAFRDFGFKKALNLQTLASYEMTLDFRRAFA